jgi:acyl-coenzyme A synthetase/AMP-(fatty) acid ligase
MKIVQSETPVPPSHPDFEDSLVLIYTSGTTGKHSLRMMNMN